MSDQFVNHFGNGYTRIHLETCREVGNLDDAAVRRPRDGRSRVIRQPGRGNQRRQDAFQSQPLANLRLVHRRETQR